MEHPPNRDEGQDAQLDSNFGPWMLVTRRRGSVRNGRNKSPLKSETNKENYKGSLVDQDSLNEVDDDIQSKSQRIDVDGSQHRETRAELTQRSHGEDIPEEDCDMALC